MNQEELRDRLRDYELRMEDMPLYEFFVESLMPEYEARVVKWVWANDRVLDLRPLWIQRESTAPDTASVLALPPLDKQYKWNYGLDDEERVIIARQENDNDSDLSFYDHFDNRVEGVHYFSYDENSTHYMTVSECERDVDGKIIAHMVLSGHEVDSEEYEYDSAGRVVRITRERNFLNPEAESERARKLRADLERLQQKRADLGLPGGALRSVGLAKSDVIVLEYAASYDDKGVSQVALHSDCNENDKLVYQRSK
jgi:hypothetical protein